MGRVAGRESRPLARHRLTSHGEATPPSPLPIAHWQVLGHKGDLPDVYVEVEISFYLLKRLLGVKTAEGGKAAKVRAHARLPCFCCLPAC